MWLYASPSQCIAAINSCCASTYLVDCQSCSLGCAMKSVCGLELHGGATRPATAAANSLRGAQTALQKQQLKHTTLQSVASNFSRSW